MPSHDSIVDRADQRTAARPARAAANASPSGSGVPAPAGDASTAASTAALTDAELRQWADDGFFLRRGFVPEATARAIESEAVGLARRAAGTAACEGALLLEEPNLTRDPRDAGQADEAWETRIAKMFKLHRMGAFRAFIERPEIGTLVRGLLGPTVDCFLSQFIFKNPGAWGQPWHQDAFYFPFDRGPQVGLWLAITETTLENGPLHVLRGSHVEPVHKHVPDRRTGALYGYVEIVDHGMERAEPVLMQPGDLLVFHSHLMHRSTDNQSQRHRAAMVYHCAVRGTKDVGGFESPVTDWMPLPDPCPAQAAVRAGDSEVAPR